jgi:hypothetical protein
MKKKMHIFNLKPTYNCKSRIFKLLLFKPQPTPLKNGAAYVRTKSNVYPTKSQVCAPQCGQSVPFNFINKITNNLKINVLEQKEKKKHS